MASTVLVVGGRGSTGRPLIQLLHEAAISTLVTSRSGKMNNLSQASSKTSGFTLSLGRIPFVSVEDIAQAAFEALTTNKITRGDLLAIGPELFYTIRREILHKRITRDGLRDIFTLFAVPAEYAYALSGAEGRIAYGTRVDAFNSPVERILVERTTLGDFFQNNKSSWQ
ncbi:hypothetical protein BJ165DRAFT_1406365 [Panaeolus papilionaceus]|nr:hypothetical protein BJ165DRAFT_1406365 [Panaeolus papilionaceus]